MKKTLTNNYKDKLIILASSSPRRLDILRANNIEPLVIAPIGEEFFDKELGPIEGVKDLALQKAQSIVDTAIDLYRDEDFLIIGADTIVFLDDIIGKPKDRDDAFKILSSLRGKTHYVTTGIALIYSKTLEEKVFHEITSVTFKDYTDQDIEDYISTDEPYDKAGAYAIQGGFAPYIDHIEGDYDNVVGFPWSRIKKEL